MKGYELKYNDINNICELYKKGLGIYKIEKITNFSIPTILKYLKLNNIYKKSTNRKYLVNENYFDIIDTEDKAYFLGLLMADGQNLKDGFSIALEETDKYILEKFIHYINYGGVLYYKNRQAEKRKNMYILQIKSMILSKSLSNYNVIPNKTHFTCLPDISKEFYSHFIRGVFDGDGCIYIDKEKTMHFSITGNVKLLEKIQEILIKECNLSKTKFNDKANTKENIKALRYGGNNQVKKIYTYLYKNCKDLYLIRKKEKFIIKN